MIRSLSRAALACALALVLAEPVAAAPAAFSYPVVPGPDGRNANPVPTVQFGAPTLAPGQVTVQTTATLIAAARAGRQSITVVSNCSNPIELGNSDVTTTTGVILPGTAGASITLNYSGALYAIGASTCPVSYYELY